MRSNELICIRCPIGCQLTVTTENNMVTKVEGNECRRGLEYAETELLNPVRNVTTTIPIRGGAPSILPVKTSTDIPKKDIFRVMAAAKILIADAPIAVGTVIQKNIAGTGADLVATRSILQK